MLLGALPRTKRYRNEPNSKAITEENERRNASYSWPENYVHIIGAFRDFLVCDVKRLLNRNRTEYTVAQESRNADWLPSPNRAIARMQQKKAGCPPLFLPMSYRIACFPALPGSLPLARR